MTQTTNTFWTFTIPDIGLGPRFMKMAKTHSRLVAADCLRRNKVSDISMVLNGLPWWLSSKESACDAEDAGDASSSKGDIHRGLWEFMESSAPFHTREECGGGRRILFKLHVGRWVKTRREGRERVAFLERGAISKLKGWRWKKAWQLPGVASVASRIKWWDGRRGEAGKAAGMRLELREGCSSCLDFLLWRQWVCVFALRCSVMSICDTMDCSPPGSSVHGTFQARTPSGLPFPPPRW